MRASALIHIKAKYQTTTTANLFMLGIQNNVSRTEFINYSRKYSRTGINRNSNQWSRVFQQLLICHFFVLFKRIPTEYPSQALRQKNKWVKALKKSESGIAFRQTSTVVASPASQAHRASRPRQKGDGTLRCNGVRDCTSPLRSHATRALLLLNGMRPYPVQALAQVAAPRIACAERAPIRSSGMNER